MPSENAITEQIEQIDKEYQQERQQVNEIQERPSNCSYCNFGSQNGIIVSLYLTTKDCFEYHKSQNDFLLPKRINSNERKHFLKESQKTKQLHKRKLYERFAFFVPDNIYQNVCEQIAHTDYDFRERQFMDAARNYRNVLMDYVRSKNGFGYAFFTPMPQSEWRDTWQEYAQDVRDKYCNGKDLEKIFTAETPRFTFFHRTKTSVTWMVLLVLLNLALGALSIQVCNKFLKFN
jgi:hypothetical protein